MTPRMPVLLLAAVSLLVPNRPAVAQNPDPSKPDAPVRETAEVVLVEVPVRVVGNARIRVPNHPLIERVLVSGKFDAADDWIAGEADARTVVITGDILLADRCLKSGATVIGHNGKPFTSASIGGAIATRAIMADLRAGGDAVGGPPPFAKTDRSRFLQALDEALLRLGRA